MDPRFQPAISAIKSGDTAGLTELLRQDPSLAVSRSQTSHPTLLQCLVLNAKNSPSVLEMARMLIEAGADVNGPLVACGSSDNVLVATLLLDRGAAVNGTGDWSPLEEALYWHNREIIPVLLARGATAHNLRIAAGLGRTDLIETFFNGDGSLKTSAGAIRWPWGGVETIRQSNFDVAVREKMTATVKSWANDRQDIINNAFVYACMHGHRTAAALLLEKGAQINAIPGGFDFAGTGLHQAALNGHQRMVQFLMEHGADKSIRDLKVQGTATAWAEHAGHVAIKTYLETA